MVIHKHTTKLIYKSRHTISTERIQGHPVLTERCGTQPRGRGLAQFKVITAYQYESTYFNMISAYYLTWWDEVEETYIYIYINIHIYISIYIYAIALISYSYHLGPTQAMGTHKQLRN
jgi:hypothetical protein